MAREVVVCDVCWISAGGNLGNLGNDARGVVRLSLEIEDVNATGYGHRGGSLDLCRTHVEALFGKSGDAPFGGKDPARRLAYEMSERA